MIAINYQEDAVCEMLNLPSFKTIRFDKSIPGQYSILAECNALPDRPELSKPSNKLQRKITEKFK